MRKEIIAVGLFFALLVGMSTPLLAQAEEMCACVGPNGWGRFVDAANTPVSCSRRASAAFFCSDLSRPLNSAFMHSPSNLSSTIFVWIPKE